MLPMVIKSVIPHQTVHIIIILLYFILKLLMLSTSTLRDYMSIVCISM